jgi:hypothetical protein
MRPSLSAPAAIDTPEEPMQYSPLASARVNRSAGRSAITLPMRATLGPVAAWLGHRQPLAASGCHLSQPPPSEHYRQYPHPGGPVPGWLAPLAVAHLAPTGCLWVPVAASA